MDARLCVGGLLWCSFVLCHGGSLNLRAPSILTKNSENVETGLMLLVQKLPAKFPDKWKIIVKWNKNSW